MAIPTITVTGDILPPSNVVTGGSVTFELSSAVSDAGAGVVVPRSITTPILASGAISVAIWPNELGVFPTRYAVYVDMLPSVPGESESRILVGYAAFAASPATQDLSEIIAQQSGPIMVGDTTYPTIAAAVAAAQAFAADAGASAASAVAITGTIIGAGNGQFQNGSAAAPSVTFASDTNTGMYRIGADTLGFSANGIERMRVTTSGAQLTGLLSGTAVTQSSTDSTAGRILKTADFGLGGSVVEFSGSTDDATLASGLYRVTATATGAKPFGNTAYNMIVARRGTSPFANSSQVAFGVPNGEVYNRDWNGTAWTAWARNYSNRSVLGTVSQSGGDPTGALIEAGSNANGSFVRYADGTQICRHRITINNTIAIAFLGGFRTGMQSWTYPAAFIAAPTVTSSPGNLNSFGVANNSVGTTTVAYAHTAVTSQGTAQDLIADFIAVGRWF